MKINLFNNIKADLLAGLVVSLISMPLCLGIALASGAPLYSGIVSGIVGGIVIGFLSRSPLSVAGPAAGLTAIVAMAITDLKAFDVFLCAVLIAGLFQFLLGILRAGCISSYFPSNVVDGMLAAIGIIIIIKQIPYLIGFDLNDAMELILLETEIISITRAFNYIEPGILIIGFISLAILVIWEQPFMKNLKAIPAALVVVVVGVLTNGLFLLLDNRLTIREMSYFVNLPIARNMGDFLKEFTLPNLAGLKNPYVWQTGFVIAVVASIETLLSIEAIDKLDPYKRYTPTDRELRAQGISNMVSAILGGLPITSVIVRSSANLHAGARTKLAAITHGVLLLLCVALIPGLLNKIPLASLAAILIMVGYKLCNPSIFVHMWKDGRLPQFIPFIVTLISVVCTDLLKGVAIGMVVSILFMLRKNMRIPFYYNRVTYSHGDIIRITLAQEVSFLNKASIKKTLENIPENTNLIIDASRTEYIDFDVLDLLKEFRDFRVEIKNIKISFIGFKNIYRIENTSESDMGTPELLSINEKPKRSSGKYRKLIRELEQNSKKK
ncbi:MAG: SulP family inorganic anion transporter [Flavobacteriales bacterium]